MIFDTIICENTNSWFQNTNSSFQNTNSSFQIMSVVLLSSVLLWSRCLSTVSYQKEKIILILFIFHRNSRIPAVDNIQCERLSQEKDFIQSLIGKQVSSVGVIKTLQHFALITFVFNREKRKIMLKEWLKKKEEILVFLVHLPKWNHPSTKIIYL